MWCVEAGSVPCCEELYWDVQNSLQANDGRSLMACNDFVIVPLLQQENEPNLLISESSTSFTKSNNRY
jgi:hypothetical protein